METPSASKKIGTLSPELQRKIKVGERNHTPRPETPVTNFLADTKRHCNGGRTVDAGFWLKEHCDKGGKIFLTMAGAGSSFQMGITISELIRAGKIAAISVTGANLEESLYRLLAHDDYAYIPDYEQLTPQEEKELDHAGFRRITDTFLPEEETVRVILPELEKLWREAEAQGRSLLWHEFFFELFERGIVDTANNPNIKNCWLYQAWKHKIEVFVPGIEDSTMGNIFTHACYGGEHPFLSKYKLKEPVNPLFVLHSVHYMHRLAEFYMNTTKEHGHAFLQLGGGIAADFPMCVVPHLKKDFMAEQTIEEQEKNIPPWAGFVEIHSSPMSYGSYSGAGGKEKITWGKLNPGAPMIQIQGDYTAHFPDIAAIVLGK